MNNIELYIIKALLKKEIYLEYKDYLDEFFTDRSFPLQKIFETIREIYSNQNSPGELSISQLSFEFFAKFPFQKKDDSEFFGKIFQKIEAIDGGTLNFNVLLSKFKERKLATDLAKVALDLADGRCSTETLLQAVAELTKHSSGNPESQISSPFVQEELKVLLQNQIYSGGLNWRLQCLRESLGPLRRGDFGFLFARPETGKTTFLASEISNFLTQVETPVLWFNNEEQGGKVLLRCYQAAFGVTSTELKNNPEKYTEMWKDSGYSGKLLLHDNAHIHRRDVLSLVERYHPSCIVFDQIDKLKGFSDDRNDLELGQIYIWARELAKQYCPVIGVCQAGGSGEDKMWLTMDDVVNAKTSKQAEADWILGIGMKHDSGNSRFLNISKNKLQGGPETFEEARHGRFQVIIRPELARYEDI